MIQPIDMSEHRHHTSRSFAVKLHTHEQPELNQQCFLNVEATEYNSKRRTLLLLHGYLGTSQDYHEFFHVFNDNFNIIAIDLRGHGSSEQCTNPNNSIGWTISDFASDIYQIVEQSIELGQKVVVIASSLSTAIALQLATNYPEIVETMLLISPTFKFKIPKWTLGLLLLERILPKKVMHNFTIAISNFLIKLAKKNKNPQMRERRIRGLEQFKKLEWSIHRKILTQALKLWKADVSMIDHPVFIIAGTEDKIVPYIDSFQINRSLRNSAFLTIHAKHQILISQVNLVTNILSQWLDNSEDILQMEHICGDNLVMINDNIRIPIINN